MTLLLVDLSGVFWSAYHASGKGIFAYELTLERLTELLARYPRTVICCEGKRPLRHQWFPEYKATRPPKPEDAVESLREIISEAKDSPLPVLECDGYEADDLIATLSVQAQEPVIILSRDKDLYALLTDNVKMLIDGKIIGPDECAAKFGVWPEQIRDYLAITGDASDNIPGCPGIGGKGAAKLLQRFGTLEAARAATDDELGLGPKTLAKFREWDPTLALKLVTLLYDAPVSVDQLWTANQSIQSTETEDDMVDMSKIVTSRKNGPLKILAYGPEGVGKTRLGAFSHKPIFLCAENGLSAPDLRDVPSFPAPETWEDVLSAISYLRTSEHGYKTLVIDSIDWLFAFAKDDVMKREGLNQTAYEAYGRGDKIAFDHWVKLMKHLDELQEARGTHIIALAHSTLKNFPNPQGEDFMRYQLSLTDKAGERWKQWPDYLLFMSQELFTKQKDSGKAKGVIGEHVFYTSRSAAFDAKNRIGLPAEIPYSTENPWRSFAEAVRKITAPAKAEEKKPEDKSGEAAA